jgi:hypothetical protein
MSHPVSQDYVYAECGACGIRFTVPEFLYTNRAKNGCYVYCPNGHQLTVPQPDEVIRLRKELSEVKAERDDKERLLCDAVIDSRSKDEEILHLTRKIVSLRGSITRTKKLLVAYKLALRDTPHRGEVSKDKPLQK